MAKALYTLLFLIALVATSFGQTYSLRLKEVDDNPNQPGVRTIIVPNGSLSCTGTVCTINFAGAGVVTGSGTNGVFTRWTGASSVGDATGVVYSAASPNVTITAQANTHVGLSLIGGAASPTVPLFVAQNPAGTTKFEIDTTTTGGGITTTLERLSYVRPGTSGLGIWANADAGGYESRLLLYSGSAQTVFSELLTVGDGAANLDLISIDNSAVLRASDAAAGGMVIVNSHATSPIIFATGGSTTASEKARFDANGLRLGIPSSVTGKLNLAASGDANITTIQSGDTPASDVVYKLPADDPSAGEVLTITSFSGGTAVTEWAAGGGMSIGGTVTSGTTGSLLFVGAGPVLAQDNTNIFWDDTNNRLGIGTATPATAIHASSSGDTEISIASTAGGGKRWTIQSGSTGTFEVIDRTSAVARMRINTTNQIMFGDIATVTPQATVHAKKNDSLGFYAESSGALSFTGYGMGRVSGSADGEWGVAAAAGQFSSISTQGDIVSRSNTGHNIIKAGASLKSIKFTTGGSTDALRQEIDSTGAAIFTSGIRTSGAAPYLRIVAPADTGQTANTEFPGIVLGGNASGATVTRTGADGTSYARQAEVIIPRPTYAYAGSTTIDVVATLRIDGDPIFGANANPNAWGALVIDNGGKILFGGTSNDVDVGLVRRTTNTLRVTTPLGGAGLFLIGNSGDGTAGQFTVISASTSRIASTPFSASGSTVATETLVHDSASGNNAVASTVFGINHNNAGGVNAGFGTRINFVLESGSGGDQQAGALDLVFSTVTAASETSAFIFNTRTGGAAQAEAMRLQGTNLGLGQTSFGTSAAKVLAFGNGTAPSTSPADANQLYSADSAAGDANLFNRNEAGEINRLTGLAARNSAQFDKTSSDSFSNITGLTRNVEAGRTYAFTAVLQTTANVAGGVKFAVSGTATATAISYEGQLVDTAAVVSQTRATALDTAVCALTTSTSGTCTIRGVIVVNAAGTLTIQFAQNTSDGNASSVLANQYFQLIPIS